MVSPHSEQVVATVPEGSAADIDAAVAAARRAFDEGPWPRMSPHERIAVLEVFSGLYAARMQEMAELITIEMGSPISFSQLAQAPAPWMQIEAFLAIARDFAWEETRPGVLGADVVVRREPVGVVAAIPPWNVPQFTTISKVVPALLAGNTVVLKPAPETPLDTYLMAELLAEAGVPAGVVNIVAADREVGEHLVAHPGVDKVAFTGSTAAGRRIAAICGEQLKRVSLELGGKSAAIVLDDADLEATMAGLRVRRADELRSGVRGPDPHPRPAQPLRRGRRRAGRRPCPACPSATLRTRPPRSARWSPGVSRSASRSTSRWVRRRVRAWSSGGNGMPAGLDRGWYVRPTVFADVDNRMRIAQEEIFGPVLSVIAYDEVDEAVRIANDSDYGLAGTVWTADAEAGLDVARQVRAGTYGVNTYTMDFAAPFGGFKDSGVGREFGPEGLGEYTELKSIYTAAPELG